MSTADEEVARLLELVRRLPPKERKAAEYFLKHVSVGDLRAVLDLERLGVKNPQEVIDRLQELGVIEKGMDCYNLVKPLREYIIRTRGVR